MQCGPKLGLLRTLAPIFLVILASCSGETERSSQNSQAQASPTREAQLELLTILGDVADEARDGGGRWREARDGDRLPQLSTQEIEELSKLQTLPYLQGYKEAPAQANVTIHDAERAYGGINVYNSGHAAEAFAMDMKGRILHRWHQHIDDVWPEVPRTFHSEFWRRAHWFPNGDILAIYEGIGIIKMNRHSRVLWKYRGGCHHQAFVADDGRIYVLTRRAQVIPRINRSRPIVPDAITVLGSKGKVQKEYSLLECIENSEFRHLLTGVRTSGDIFHTNSLYVFDGTQEYISPHFAKGNFLVSLLKLDLLAIVDPKQEKVVWAKAGTPTRQWKRQHDPTLLPNGRFMLFDNVGRDGQSKVIEFDPFNLKVYWEYAGDEENDLSSKTCGLSTRLPNGNTLITESDNGRALEVTNEGDIVWEFYNPHRAGETGELIATLFEMNRFDRAYFEWLEQ